MAFVGIRQWNTIFIWAVPFVSFVFFFQIVNWADPSWWQARKVNSKERPGLVPSQDLEERRKCFVKHTVFAKQVSCCGTTVSQYLLFAYFNCSSVSCFHSGTQRKEQVWVCRPQKPGLRQGRITALRARGKNAALQPENPCLCQPSRDRQADSGP